VAFAGVGGVRCAVAAWVGPLVIDKGFGCLIRPCCSPGRFCKLPRSRARFDLVGFDRRGTNRNPALFGNPRQWGPYFTPFAFLGTPVEEQTRMTADLYLAPIAYGAGPGGFQNSATRLDLGFYAARLYSLMSPPRTGRRLIRFWRRSATGWSGRGGRSWRL